MGDVGSTKKGEAAQLRHAPGDDQGLGEALKSITAKVLLMPCRTDQYFPPEDNEGELKHLKYGTLAVIESSWGHIAGGGANPADIVFMDARIAEHMQR